MFLTYTNESKTGFGNRKWNYPNRKWNYFSYFLSSNQKTSFTKCFQLLITSLKSVLKQERELFLLLSELQSKNFSYKMFLTITSKSKTDFQNRKWDYQNRKWNYFSYFLSSNKKNLLQNFYNSTSFRLHLDFIKTSFRLHLDFTSISTPSQT